MMQSGERLEIVFTSQPTTITSTICVNGEQIAQKTFRNEPNHSVWTSTLEDIAKATRNSQKRAASLKPDGGDIAYGHDHYCAQAPATSRPESHILQRRDDSSQATNLPTSSTLPSSDGTETASFVTGQCPGTLPVEAPRQLTLLTRILAETDNAESTNMTSPEWSTTTGKATPLSSGLIHPVRHADGENVSILLEAALFNRESTSLISSPSLSVYEAGSSSLVVSMASKTSAENQTPSVKRRGKLDILLLRILDQTNPDLSEHNKKVESLCNSAISFSTTVPTTVEQFGQLLGDLGHVSDILGFMYSLLSWEVFRREEERLIQEEGQSARWAAKRMNDEMSKQSDRHATSKDWASDGRRAAGMIFSSISELSAVSKSLAVFLLADLVILDNLIKIAHFPVLKERFAIVFKEIHKAREKENGAGRRHNYKVFDFDAFISTHGRSINLGSFNFVTQQTLISEQEIPRPLIQSQDLSLLDCGYVDPDANNTRASPRKRRRVSQINTAGNGKAMWSTYLGPSNNDSDPGPDTSPNARTKLRDLSALTSADETPSGRIANSAETDDYNILFCPSSDFSTSFQGPGRS